MPTYEKCETPVERLAIYLMEKFESHHPLIDQDVKIDFLFARGDVNDKGIQINDAITQRGHRALGLTKVVSLKDRVLGRGDVEVMLDGDYWSKATEEEQAALLDHELHHISLKADRAGNVKFDDIGRPLIQLRKHDIEVGWFTVIAQRHGLASQERIQAKAIMDMKGQFFWPGIAPTVEISLPDGRTTGPMPVGALTKAAATKV